MTTTNLPVPEYEAVRHILEPLAIELFLLLEGEGIARLTRVHDSIIQLAHPFTDRAPIAPNQIVSVGLAAPVSCVV